MSHAPWDQDERACLAPHLPLPHQDLDLPIQDVKGLVPIRMPMRNRRRLIGSKSELDDRVRLACVFAAGFDPRPVGSHKEGVAFTIRENDATAFQLDLPFPLDRVCATLGYSGS